jgi:hypothetical protein
MQLKHVEEIQARLMQLKPVEKFKQEIHTIVKRFMQLKPVEEIQTRERFMQLLKPVEENIQGTDS